MRRAKNWWSRPWRRSVSELSPSPTHSSAYCCKIKKTTLLSPCNENSLITPVIACTCICIFSHIGLTNSILLLGWGRNEETDGADPPDPSNGSRPNNPTEVCGSDCYIRPWIAQWDVHCRGQLEGWPVIGKCPFKNQYKIYKIAWLILSCSPLIWLIFLLIQP